VDADTDTVVAEVAVAVPASSPADAHAPEAVPSEATPMLTSPSAETSAADPTPEQLIEPLNEQATPLQAAEGTRPEQEQEQPQPGPTTAPVAESIPEPEPEPEPELATEDKAATAPNLAEPSIAMAEAAQATTAQAEKSAVNPAEKTAAKPAAKRAPKPKPKPKRSAKKSPAQARPKTPTPPPEVKPEAIVASVMLDEAALWEKDDPVKSRLAQLRARNALLEEQLQRMKPPFQARGKKP